MAVRSWERGGGSSTETALPRHVLQITTKHPLTSSSHKPPALHAGWTGLLGENNTVCPVTEPAPNALNDMNVKTGREQQNFPIITSWRWSKYLDAITVSLLPICPPPFDCFTDKHTHTHTRTHTHTHTKQVKTSASAHPLEIITITSRNNIPK